MAVESQLPVVCTAGLCIDPDKRLLVIRRTRQPRANAWSLPGGRLHFGERAEVGVLRELVEETGLLGRRATMIGTHQHIDPDHHLIVLIHRVEGLSGSIRPGDDAAEAAWVPVSSLTPQNSTLDLLRAALVANSW
ncbi:NUDIX domain-containing protein [Nocardia asteroides]|uniref:NUDIX domain-containing protein n=1 Tax=Nocardia asteroides TaxID=1824 RepID=UPI0033D49C51